MWFEALSGLKINLEKSELISIRRVEGMDLLAAELGCKVGRLPSTYLGLPLGALYKFVRVWDGVEERFRKRLTLWKSQHISKGDRATLIKSTLSNLPIFFLFCCPFLKLFYGVVVRWIRSLILLGGRQCVRIREVEA